VFFGDCLRTVRAAFHTFRRDRFGSFSWLLSVERDVRAISISYVHSRVKTDPF
jgi:hypothetical protein